MYSIVFDMESHVGGANGQQNSKVFLVDVKTIALQQIEIIIDSEQNRDKLYHLLLHEFKYSENIKSIFPRFLEEWVKDKNNHFSNMF